MVFTSIAPQALEVMQYGTECGNPAVVYGIIHDEVKNEAQQFGDALGKLAYAMHTHPAVAAWFRRIMEGDVTGDVVWDNMDYEQFTRLQLQLILGQRHSFCKKENKPVWMTGAWKPYHQVSCMWLMHCVSVVVFADDLAGGGDGPG